MSVAFIWTKTNQTASRLIRWGLNEPCSHFAIVREFATPGAGLVINQAFHGFDIAWYPSWIKNNQVVYALTPKTSLTTSEWATVRDPIMNRFAGTEYDFESLYYFAYRAILRKALGIPLPTKNLWGDKKEPLCTGIAKILHDVHPEWFTKTPEDFDMVSPYQLYLMMNGTGLFDTWSFSQNLLK